MATMLDLPCHVLPNIFQRLSLEEKLFVLPCVCSAWKKVCSDDPACWGGKVDLNFSRLSTFGNTDRDRLARLLVKEKNRGLVCRFHVPFLSSADMLLDDSTSASMLRVLQVPHNQLPEDILCQLAVKFTSLTSLDLTSSSSLSAVCVEAFGNNCPNITHLKVNVTPQIKPCSPNDDIAFAVGNTMRQLEHLEMAYGSLSNAGLKLVMEMCPKLQALDLRGCWHVDMDDIYAKEVSQRLKVFHAPIVKDDIYDDEFDSDHVSDEDCDSDIYIGDYSYELGHEYVDSDEFDYNY